MYIPALVHEQAARPDEPLHRSAHYWCNCTVTETGPDDQPAAPHRCQASRRCFEE